MSTVAAPAPTLPAAARATGPAPAPPEALGPILAQPWYSTVELAPGVFTAGANHLNVGITRRLLHRCRIAGSRCLDIGAMEGVLATRMARMGGKVVAVDGVDATAKINAVKSVYGVEFPYMPA